MTTFLPRASLLRRFLLTATLLGAALQSLPGASLSENFDGPALLDWVAISRTDNASGQGWRLVSAVLGENDVHLIDPRNGAAMATTGFEAVASGAGTISEWLISPVIYGLNNGDTVVFYTRTIADSPYPDRLEVRLSSAGASTDVGANSASVGDFTVLLTTVNPSLAVSGYPESWSAVEATISGLSAPVTGRLALRYFVADGGPGGSNSNRVVIDDLAYTANTPDRFKITETILQPTREMTFTFDSEPNRVYRLDYSTDLATWTPLVDEVVSQGTVSRAGDGGRLDADPVISVGMRHDARRFYRLIDLGATRSPDPSVTITDVTANETYSDELAVTITSTVGGGGQIDHVRLFVDGIEVASDSPAGDTITLTINTSEFSNGPHHIHATASASVLVAPGVFEPLQLNTRPWVASSAPISVNFDNYVSEWSFDPVLFEPEGTNTRSITAKLGTSTSWVMEIYDEYGEAIVKTFTGSGSQIAVNWDGKDESGNIVPWGFYKHRITFPSEGSASAFAIMAASTTKKSPPPAPTKTTVNIGKNNFTVGAAYIEDYPDGIIPDGSNETVRDLPPAPLEAERFISTMAKYGYKKKYLKENPRMNEVVGQVYGGAGLLKTATFGYIIGHGLTSFGNARFFNLPAGSMALVANSLLLYSPEDSIYQVPLQSFQIGDNTFPNSNCKWLLVAGCAMFSDDVVTATLSGTQAATYPLLGEDGHGILGFATPAVIDCNLGANWAKGAHQKTLNATTGQYDQNTIVTAWWAAGLRSQRNGNNLTGGDIVMRAIYRRGYSHERTPNLLGSFDPESTNGQLISRSRRVAPDVATDIEMTP